MGWKHTAPAWKIRLPHLAHHVLLALAHQACEDCGITWLGVQTIHERTGIGVTGVRAALKLLVDRGLVAVYAYPRGGRGKSTEYRVLPQEVPVISTTLCANCVERQQKPPRGGGNDRSVTAETHRTGLGFSGNPPDSTGKTHRTGLDHSSEHTHSSGAQARDPKAVASPPVSSSTHLSDEQAAENARRAAEMVASLSAGKALPDFKPREPRNT